jgi:hypothetical protein
VVLTACPLFLPAISVASTSNFGAQEPWNRSSHASTLVVRLTVNANTETPELRNHRGHGHHRPGGPSVSGSAMGHIENICRCRIAADWFVLRSERTSNSHIFGESHAVLVSCLRH